MPTPTKSKKPASRMIVKVQVSIVTTCARRQMVIYNEDRSIFDQRDLTPMVRRLMRGKLKAYFHATYNDQGNLTLGLEADEQDW